jgi:hypothetical protein
MEKKVTVISSPHQRESNKTIKPAITTEQEFYEIINNASWQELKEYGFRKWDTMNNIIRENIAIEERDNSRMVTIPVFNATSVKDTVDLISGIIDGDIVKADSTMLIDLSPKEPLPMQLLEADEDVILFPGEWYGIIPDGFKCTSLNGEQCVFVKGKSDNDIRFGCIPYGIRRVIA